MASIQEIVEQLVLLAANSTTDVTFTTSTSRGPVELLTSTFTMLFSASALRDWAILLILGSLFETARRLLSSAWRAFINAFFITAVFEEYDDSFDWIMLWLSNHPSWKSTRNFQISTSSVDIDVVPTSSRVASSAYSWKVDYLPAVSETYTLWHKYHWMGVSRVIGSIDGGRSARESITISVMTRNHRILADIIQDAKVQYVESQKDKILVFVSDTSNDWRALASCSRRPLNSIILDPGIKELVVEDVRDFLNSKKWYTERGIPFRRGYLLHGAPGSGKTSLIHSIAGELGLDVYIISLSRSGLDDTSLSELISALPARCIALMEDIDAAFHHGLSRESPNKSSTQTSDGRGPTGNRISLSGLLNALDGIGAQEGRVLFATTNKYGSLDQALSRPGRMDLHIEFKLASRFQVEELFKRFYAPSSSAAHTSESKHVTTSDKGENGHASGEAPLIDLSEPRLYPPPATLVLTSSPLSPSEKVEGGESLGTGPKSGPIFVGVVHNRRPPTFSNDEIKMLAIQFALSVPERQLSMASLQGFLMLHKTRPFAAVAEVGAWVESELTHRKEAQEYEGDKDDSRL